MVAGIDGICNPAKPFLQLIVWIRCTCSALSFIRNERNTKQWGVKAMLFIKRRLGLVL